MSLPRIRRFHYPTNGYMMFKTNGNTSLQLNPDNSVTCQGTLNAENMNPTTLTIGNSTGTSTVSYISNDSTLAGDHPEQLVTQHAVKTYINSGGGFSGNATSIEGIPVDTTKTPTDGQVLVYNSTSNKWDPTKALILPSSLTTNGTVYLNGGIYGNNPIYCHGYRFVMPDNLKWMKVYSNLVSYMNWTEANVFDIYSHGTHFDINNLGSLGGWFRAILNINQSRAFVNCTYEWKNYDPFLRILIVQNNSNSYALTPPPGNRSDVYLNIYVQRNLPNGYIYGSTTDWKNIVLDFNLRLNSYQLGNTPFTVFSQTSSISNFPDGYPNDIYDIDNNQSGLLNVSPYYSVIFTSDMTEHLTNTPAIHVQVPNMMKQFGQLQLFSQAPDMIPNVPPLLISFDPKMTVFSGLYCNSQGRLILDSEGSSPAVMTADPLLVTNTTVSNSTTTGAAVISGGLGVAGQVTTTSLQIGNSTTNTTLVDTSDTLSANLDTSLPTQKAVKTYVNNLCAATRQDAITDSAVYTDNKLSGSINPSSIKIGSSTTTTTLVDTDGTLTANLDTSLPTQKAVKTYVNTAKASANAISIANVPVSLDSSTNGAVLTYSTIDNKFHTTNLIETNYPINVNTLNARVVNSIDETLTPYLQINGPSAFPHWLALNNNYTSYAYIDTNSYGDLLLNPSSNNTTITGNATATNLIATLSVTSKATIYTDKIAEYTANSGTQYTGAGIKINNTTISGYTPTFLSSYCSVTVNMPTSGSLVINPYNVMFVKIGQFVHCMLPNIATTTVTTGATHLTIQTIPTYLCPMQGEDRTVITSNNGTLNDSLVQISTGGVIDVYASIAVTGGPSQWANGRTLTMNGGCLCWCCSV